MQAQRIQQWRVMRVTNVSTGAAVEVGVVAADDVEVAQQLAGDMVGDFQTFRVERVSDDVDQHDPRNCAWHDCDQRARYVVINTEHDVFPFKTGAALVCTHHLSDVSWPHLWMPLGDFYRGAERGER